MNEIELVQLPNGIENFLLELKPARKAKWNYELRKYEEDNSPETIERQRAGCELVKDSLRDIYSFGETIARGTPKFCLALKRIFDNLRCVEGEANIFPYGSELGIKGSMGDYSCSDENFTKLVGQLGLSSTSAYRYKDLGRFVDEQTGDWLNEFKGYSVSLLSEIWSFAVESYQAYHLKDLSKVIPANTTIADMRLYRKIRKLEKKGKTPFEKYEDRKNITDNTPLPKVLKIYNKLIQKQEAEQKKEESSATAVAEELHTESEYPGQLPGQTAMTFAEVQSEPEAVIPDVGNDIEPESVVSEEPEAVGYPGAMTNEELAEYCLKYDVHEIVKFNIIDFYVNREPGMSQFKEYVKSTYLNYGLWGAGFKFKYCEGTSDNFTIFRKNGSKNILAWSVVSGRISRLIQVGSYLDDREKEEYLKWKAEIEAPSEDVSDEKTEEDPAELKAAIPDVGKVIDIEPELTPRRQRTNREYLAELSDEQFVSELCLKIIRIFPMGGKSSQFMSTVKDKLTEWFGEICAEASNE